MESNVAHNASVKDQANKTLFVLLAEKLDKSEVRDLILTSLYILNNIPKKILAAFCNAQDMTNNNTNGVNNNQANKNDPKQSPHQTQTQNLLLDFIRFLELSLLTFQYRGRVYHIMKQSERSKSKAGLNLDSNTDSFNSYRTSGQMSSITDFSDSFGQTIDEETKSTLSNGYLLDCHLSQEVALIILETVQTISNQIAGKTKYLSSKFYDTIFSRLLNLELELLNERWSEAVRLQTLAFDKFERYPIIFLV